MVSVGGRMGSVSEGASHDGPSLSSFRFPNTASTGSFALSVYGSGMGLAGYTGSWRAGATAAERTEWVSDTCMFGLIGAWARGSGRMSVTVGQVGGSVTTAQSVERAVLSVIPPTNGAATGSASVTVVGAGMGLDVSTGAARVGRTGCELTAWESDTSMRCNAGQGASGSQRVSVSVHGSVGSVSAAFSVGGPVLSVQGRSNGGSTGSIRVTMHGANLGEAV